MRTVRGISVRAAAVVLAVGAMTFHAGLRTAVAAEKATVTGVVADAMCGLKHHDSDAAACTRHCVQAGSDYALIAGDKALTLKASDSLKAELDKLAGKKATVSGERDGDTITVASVQPAK